MTTENADQMDWYYEAAGSAIGPISADEFAAKRSASIITPDTKVWTAEMGEWEPLRNIPTAPGAETTAIIPNANGDITLTAQCDECSRLTSKDDLLAYGNLLICTSCKDTFVDKLKQGVRVGGGPWRDRRAILFNEGTELPMRCLKCNESAGFPLEKNLSNISPWLLLLILFGIPGILIYLIVGFSMRRRARVKAYLCHRHLKRRKVLLIFNWILFSASLTLMLFYIGQVIEVDHFFFVVPVSFLGFLMSGILGLRLQLFRVQRVKDGVVRASGPSRKFLDSLQEWRDS